MIASTKHVALVKLATTGQAAKLLPQVLALHVPSRLIPTSLAAAAFQTHAPTKSVQGVMRSAQRVSIAWAVGLQAIQSRLAFVQIAQLIRLITTTWVLVARSNQDVLSHPARPAIQVIFAMDVRALRQALARDASIGTSGISSAMVVLQISVLLTSRTLRCGQRSARSCNAGSQKRSASQASE